MKKEFARRTSALVVASFAGIGVVYINQWFLGLIYVIFMMFIANLILDWKKVKSLKSS